MIQVGFGTYDALDEDILLLIEQLGISEVLITPTNYVGRDSPLPMGEVWTRKQLNAIKSTLRAHGLSLHAIEKMPIPLYDILLDSERLDENISIITQTIENVGAAQISMLGYSGHPPGGSIRTSSTHSLRGGSVSRQFKVSEMDPSPTNGLDPISRETLWDRYDYFLNSVLPVAENHNVTLALHPTDPPLESIDGIPLLFSDFSGMERALYSYDSESHSLKFCLGTWSAMGVNVLDVIHHFGGDNIAYVHFRDVVGSVPCFHETFIDDDESNHDPVKVLQTLQAEGFEGVITTDHVPQMYRKGTEGEEIGNIYTIGYLKGMIDTIYTNS